MPVSPKDGKPVLSSDTGPMEPDAAKMHIKTENTNAGLHQTTPNIFTFNPLPTSSKFPFRVYCVCRSSLSTVAVLILSSFSLPQQTHPRQSLPPTARTNEIQIIISTVRIRIKVNVHTPSPPSLPSHLPTSSLINRFCNAKSFTTVTILSSHIMCILHKYTNHFFICFFRI